MDSLERGLLKYGRFNHNFNPKVARRSTCIQFHMLTFLFPACGSTRVGPILLTYVNYTVTHTWQYTLFKCQLNSSKVSTNDHWGKPLQGVNLLCANPNLNSIVDTKSPLMTPATRDDTHMTPIT